MAAKLYDLELSGNCYKVRLLAALLGVPLDVVPVDFLGGAHKRPPFIDLNAFGDLPIFEDGGLVLRDSQAILVYMARKWGGEMWLPTDAVGLTLVTGWLMVAEMPLGLWLVCHSFPFKNKVPKPEQGEKGVTVPTTSAVRDKLSGMLAVSNLESIAVQAATAARAFHWPLEFPQVFFPAAGRKAGFDLALGNPPWERIKLQEQEFFASRAPEIANAPNAAARRAKIEALQSAPQGSAKRMLYDEFSVTKRIAEASSIFARVPVNEGGRYPLTGTGDVNTYALFAELFATIARRSGIIVPTELATSDTTKAFFSSLVDNGRLRAMYDFQTGMGFFDRIGHARFKFSLFVIEPPRQLANPSFKVAFFLRTQAEMADRSRYLEMTKADIAAINPNTKTAPIFRSKADAELTSQIYARVPVLIDEAGGAAGNPWGIQFQAMFHMSGDSELFRTARQLEIAGLRRDGVDWVAKKAIERYVPLYEAKMVHHYDHRWATYEDGVGDKDSRNLMQSEKARPAFEATPRYWIPENAVGERLASKDWTPSWLMGWRDICRATDERTVIAGAIPRSGVGDKFLLAMPGVDARAAVALLATMSSLSFDFVARQKLGGTSLKYFTMKQLVAPRPSAFTPDNLAFIVPRVLELTYTSHSMRPFAEDLGYTGAPFAWNEDRRASLRFELDARIAKLFGLTRDQLRYILDPSDIYGADYPSETFRVLKNNDIAKYGEYRTAKLVLQAFDQLTAGTLATEVVRLDADKIEVRTPAPTSIPLAVNTWARSRIDARGETGAMVAALLKTIDGPTPIRQVRLAAVLALEPRLLTQQLDVKLSAEWQRIIGDEARPLPKGVVQFVPPADETWGAAVRGLRTRGNLVEDLRAGTWAPGTGLDKIETEGWPEGRAGFVLEFLRSQGNQPVFDALPEEARRWLDAEAA